MATEQPIYSATDVFQLRELTVSLSEHLDTLNEPDREITIRTLFAFLREKVREYQEPEEIEM